MRRTCKFAVREPFSLQCSWALWMRIAVLFSGGKDSTLSLYRAIKAGHTVTTLVTMLSSNPESYMFHVPCAEFTQYQARAMRLPLVQVRTPGVKEVELADLKRTLQELKSKGVEGVVSGAIASEYQKKRVDNICRSLGLKSLAPLWGENPESLLREVILNKFEVIFVAVSAKGLDEKWLGRKLDRTSLEELKAISRKYGVHLSLEGGEGETFVLDCPLFKEKIIILESRRVWKRDAGFLEIQQVKLEAKT